MYEIPSKYYYRLHHIRPRFKNDIETVLINVANALSRLEEKPKKEFDNALDKLILAIPGNTTRTEKTIANWRTEISALFGFIVSGTSEKSLAASRRAIELSSEQDLVAAFKKFLFFFQYPGGHKKPSKTLQDVLHKVHFQPAKFILELLTYAEEYESSNQSKKNRVSLNKAESTHIIFNDLRVTSNIETIPETWERLKNNKNQSIEYDWTGDVIRYAGDILDYMVVADLLVTYDNKNYYLNSRNTIAIAKFIESSIWFSNYDQYIASGTATIQDITQHQSAWFEYVNQPIDAAMFETDIVSLIATSDEEYEALKKEVSASFHEKIESGGEITTKEIGDMGESLIHGHECMRIKLHDRGDLIHLIKIIPTHLAMGFDISSVEEDATKRFIEVKTTISSKRINFNRFHLTDNEWNAANSHGDRYFVYRLFLSKEDKKLLVMQNPVRLYKESKIDISIKNGVDVSFTPDTCCKYEELLIWDR